VAWVLIQIKDGRPRGTETLQLTHHGKRLADWSI